MRTIFRLLGGALALAAGAQAALAQGMACQQDCVSGTCAQTECFAGGAGGGFCQCSSGSVPLGGGVYASYCRAWGVVRSGCGYATSAVDQFGNSMAVPTPQLPNASAMSAALSSRNPFVAALVLAMQDGGSWVDAPMKGFLHDSHYDSGSGAVTHTSAVQFVAKAVATGAGGEQIDITVQGDAGQLGWLRQYCAMVAPAAVPPAQIHGVVTDGGLHGNLVAQSAGGQSQTIQW